MITRPTTNRENTSIHKAAFIVVLLAGIAILETGCVGLSHLGPGSYATHTAWFSCDFKGVDSIEDIPSVSMVQSAVSFPNVHKERQYTEVIEVRDAISLLILDISKHSIFYKQGDPFIYGPVTVPESGILAIPFIGEVHAVGKDQTQLAAHIYKTLKTISSSAEVAIQRTARLPKIASVMGEVRAPGPIQLDREGLKLFDLLALAGGTGMGTHAYSYTLHRDGKEYKYHERVFTKLNIMAEDGDILVVERDPMQAFYVLGAVRRPGIVPFPIRHPTLTDALAAASGLDINTSNPRGVFIFRQMPDEEQAMIYGVNFRKANCYHLAGQFQLQGGDVIYVSEAPLSTWRRFLASLLPFGQVIESSNRISGVE